MHFDELLARSAMLEDRLVGFFALPLVNASSRLQATQALASLGFEHARGLKHLVQQGCTPLLQHCCEYSTNH
jgi:hypothetical protein